jgi:predicted nucleic acid-binding protein
VGGFDFDAARRWSRFDPKRTLRRRIDADLPFVDEARIAGGALLLDTCAYIDQLKGRAPEILDRLIEARQVHHSTIAVQELMHAAGRLDPADARTARAITDIGSLIKAMPAHRLLTPDAETLGRAALLSGMLCRLQGYAKDARLKALSDCVLVLQAHRHGLTVLTANIAEFDILLQLVADGRVLFYRCETLGA